MGGSIDVVGGGGGIVVDDVYYGVFYIDYGWVGGVIDDCLVWCDGGEVEFVVCMFEGVGRV